METDFPRVHLLIVGDSGVGKTTITHRFASPDSDTDDVRHATTIGVDFTSRMLYVKELQREAAITIMDVPGNTRFAPYLKLYYRQANAFLLVYDISDCASFENLESRWMQEIDLHGNNTNDEIKKPLILIGNKVDRRDGESGETCVTKKEGEAFAKKIKASFYFETSAKDWKRELLLTPLELTIVITLKSMLQLRNEEDTTRIKLGQPAPNGDAASCC